MDPLGFILIRRLLQKAKADDVTVILNSHHLAEVEKVCDRVAFIRKGKIESIENLKDAGENKQTLVLQWVDNGSDDQVDTFKRVVGEIGLSILDHNLNTARIVISNKEQAAELIRCLIESGLPVCEAKLERRSLVELFLGNGENGEATS